MFCEALKDYKKKYTSTIQNISPHFTICETHVYNTHYTLQTFNANK